MGWSDGKIRKAFALIIAAPWVVLAYGWFKGWHGFHPHHGWSVAFTGAIVLWSLWDAFLKGRPMPKGPKGQQHKHG
jgi:hypothetical protein